MGRVPRRKSGSSRGRAVLALLGLIALDAIASAVPAGGAASDVSDTRARLARIYKRLGIDRSEGPAPEEAEGCLGRQRETRLEPEIPGSAAPRMPEALGYLLIGLVVLAMGVPLVLVLRRSFRDARRQSDASPDESDEEPAAPSAPGDWRVDLEACRRLVAAGRLAEAYASLHRLTLLELERRQHLSLDGRTTNWQYVRRLSSKLELREALAEVTQSAEESILGRRPPEAARYAELERMLLDRVARATGEAR